MKILMCSPFTLTKRGGAAKVWLELAESLDDLGWICKVTGPEEISHVLGEDLNGRVSYAHQLREYITRYACNFDVIDYDHSYLPFARSEFTDNVLLVARSVLLGHHFLNCKIPTRGGLRGIAARLLKGRKVMNRWKTDVKRAEITLRNADIINVACNDDKDELIKCGFPLSKILVAPYGLRPNRFQEFDALSSAVPSVPTIAFVGTFDYRKGAKEFPLIVKLIRKELPSVQFRLLGTAGMFPDALSVLQQFPLKDRAAIQVMPRFEPSQLPTLLADCSIGIFPSYIEGFGFGVLEMLAASLPVIAYLAPGPNMMLPLDHMVRRGDARSLAKKVVVLLKNPNDLLKARNAAKKRSLEFDWRSSALKTAEAYVVALKAKREHSEER